MRIKNGLVFRENATFTRTDLAFDETITYIGKIDGEADLDAEGKYIIPGLVDIHSHGAVNADASDGDAEGLARMSGYYADRGVTSWCPTTMTLPGDTLVDAMHAIRDFRTEGANCVGIHLEGPFLSASKKGAQAGEYLRKPDPELFYRLMEESGNLVRMITVAPEEEGAMEFIRQVSRGCTVSLGHSAADYDTAMRAFENGASHITHMFNGMNGLHHREPGIIGAAYDAGASVELICDGLHIHPTAVRMAHQLFDGRLALISDSMRCAGMPDGNYSLGGQPVSVRDGKATLEDGTLAGSSIHLMDALQRAIAFGIPFEKAVLAATFVPAKVIGMENEIGRLEVGCRADLLILDEKKRLETVIIGGKVRKNNK